MDVEDSSEDQNKGLAGDSVDLSMPLRRETKRTRTAEDTSPTEPNPIATIVNDKLPMLDLADEGLNDRLLVVLLGCIEDELPETTYLDVVVRSTTLTFARQNSIQIEKAKITEFAKEVANALQRDSNKDEDPMRDQPAELTLGLDVNRVGTFDLDEFSLRIDKTFQWHDNDHENYISPSFAIIQSSGMGKTKLMKDYRDLLMQNIDDSNTSVQLILCRDSQTALPKQFKEHFDHSLEIPPTRQGTTDEDLDTNISARDKVLSKLKEIISKTDRRRIVLLFDESQFLVQGDAGIYVAIRWWLRQVRTTQRIVAVFAGTLVSLANYQRNQPTLGWTRDTKPEYKNYDEKSSQNVEQRLYPPFYTLTTSGLERISRSKNVEEWDKTTAEVDDQLLDIRRHGYFGRPLFAAMLKPLPGETESSLYLTKDCVQENRITNDKLYAIVRRMLLSHGTSESWFEESLKGNREAIASVLAARIQMGRASYDFVKEATSKGYAQLVYCSAHDESKLQGRRFGLACIEYPPEPICAAMAMGLMTLGWEVAKKSNKDVIKGLSPNKWVEPIGEIFDQEIFIPNRGDAGEIFAALYMLLCGDALRKNWDTRMRVFEIDLQAWFHQLVQSQQILNNFISGEFHVNFIQITRNYYRSHSWMSQQGLELMYDVAVGCYVYLNCPAIDIVVPVKDGAGNYYPMLISVKCWNEFTTSNMKESLNSMSNYLMERRKENSKGLSKAHAKALCVLLVIGSEKVAEPITMGGKFPEEDAFVTVVIPAEDKYGITEELTRRMTRSIEAEVLASPLYAQVEDPKNTAKCLHSKAKNNDIDFAKKLIDDKSMER